MSFTNWQTFNPVDVGLALILVLSFVLGAWRGLVREVFALAAWVLAFALAKWYGFAAAHLLEGWVSADLLRWVLGYALVFGLVWLVVTLVGSMTHGLVGMVGMGWFNRLAGGVFGLMRGGLLVLLVVVLAALAPLAAKSASWQGSRLVNLAQRTRTWVTPLLPQQLLEHLPAPQPGRRSTPPHVPLAVPQV